MYIVTRIVYPLTLTFYYHIQDWHLDTQMHDEEVSSLHLDLKLSTTESRHLTCATVNPATHKATVCQLSRC